MESYQPSLPQPYAQWPHVGSLKLARVGVLALGKLVNAVVRGFGFFPFFPPHPHQSQQLNIYQHITAKDPLKFLRNRFA